MNKNNLENLQGEMRALRFDDHFIKQMEEQMEKNLPAFELKGQLPADKGQMDVTLHFKRSAQSEFYYFNHYDLAMSKAKPLENDLKYLVISPNEPGKKPENLIRKFDSPTEAIAYFREQTGRSELAIGKSNKEDLPFKVTAATMKDGKVDYVSKEFNQAYYSPSLTNSHYVEKGVGYNVEQGSNMLQGRAAFRNDLVSRAGEQYQAWNIIAFDKPKDKYGNYKVQQYNENYGFDVKKSLDDYRIKHLDDPKKSAELITELNNGNRPVVTVEGKDGKEVAMRIEAVPRYGNINFFQLNGKPEKREDLLKEQKQEQSLTKGNSKKKDLAESQEMSI
jgi:hypothetical protein